MKKLITIGGIIIAGFILLELFCVPFVMYTGYKWNQQVENYFILSDKASTIDKKLEYLKIYKQTLMDKGLNTGESAFFFHTPLTDLSRQMGILDTLISRLESASKLSENSLEYQQALKQISTDEYSYFNSCVFAEGYMVKQGIKGFFFQGTGNCQNGENKITTSN